MTHFDKTLALVLAAAIVPACATEGDAPFGDDSSLLLPGEPPPLDDIAPPAAPEVIECTEANDGEVVACEHEHYEGVVGTSQCDYYPEDGQGYWTFCAYETIPECAEGTTWNGQCCETEFHCCDYATECNTPLVLNFGHGPVSFDTDVPGGFDLTGTGVSTASDWPAAATPWLALDRDGNGRIDGGQELFGSATPLASGVTAEHGFEGLAELDADGDGFITPLDPAFVELRVWADLDRDRMSSADELSSLADRGVTYIALGYTVAPRCDARGNCERERAAIGFEVDGAVHEGAVVDVYLATQR